MARPREFDERQVLNAALQVFWTQGYEGTSVRELTQATGLQRASLYGAFGDKAQLFEQALGLYLERMADLTRGLASGSVRRGLAELFDRWLSITCPASGPQGCFLLVSALGSSDDPLQRLAARSSRKLRVELERALARGQEQGELQLSSSPRELASMLVVFMQGIGIAGRLGKSRRELKTVARTALTFLSGADPQS